MSSVILSNLSNINEKKENGGKSSEKLSKKKKKKKNSSESKNTSEAENRKKLLRKYFRNKIYRPIKIRRILGSEVIGEKIIFTYCDEKGDIMKSEMEDLLKDDKYASLVFDFLNRRQGSVTTHFECGLYKDKSF
uniref:Uncharacterized protein n=1 Tax=Strongyloides stercoralis TaxID=6248 RepID=A0AAF5DGR2_STRER